MRPDKRGLGYGRLLVEHIGTEMVRARLATLIAVAVGDSKEMGFWEATDFEVGKPNLPLNLPVGPNAGVTLPLTGDDFRWVWKSYNVPPSVD